MNLSEAISKNLKSSMSKLTKENLLIFSIRHQSNELEFEIIYCEKCKNYFVADFWSHYRGNENIVRPEKRNPSFIDQEEDGLSKQRVKPSTLSCPECKQKFRKLWPWQVPQKIRY